MNTVSILLTLGVVAGLGLAAQQPNPSAASADGAKQAPPATGQTAQTPAKWPVSFIDTAAPPTRVNSANHLIITPFLGNASPGVQDVTIEVAMRSTSGAFVDTTLTCRTLQTDKADGGKKIPPENQKTSKIPGSCLVTLPETTPLVPVEIDIDVKSAARDAYPLNGVLTLRPSDGIEGAEPQPRITLMLSGIGLESAPSDDWKLVAQSGQYALIAVAVGVVTCLALWGWSLLRSRMGSATFSFTDSWSGALMIGGPLLTAFLTTFTAFPEYAHTMSKKSYLLLSLLLSVLIGLGPTIFNLCKLPTRVTNADGTESTQNQGLVAFFFLAACVALTGGLGQLQLLAFVLRDLTSAAFISQPLGESLVSAGGVLFWLVFAGSIVSTVTTVAAATAHPSPAVAPGSRFGGKLKAAASALEGAANAKQAGAAGQRLPTWSMP